MRVLETRRIESIFSGICPEITSSCAISLLGVISMPLSCIFRLLMCLVSL